MCDVKKTGQKYINMKTNSILMSLEGAIITLLFSTADSKIKNPSILQGSEHLSSTPESSCIFTREFWLPSPHTPSRKRLFWIRVKPWYFVLNTEGPF